MGPRAPQIFPTCLRNLGPQTPSAHNVFKIVIFKAQLFVGLPGGGTALTQVTASPDVFLTRVGRCENLLFHCREQWACEVAALGPCSVLGATTHRPPTERGTNLYSAELFHCLFKNRIVVEAHRNRPIILRSRCVPVCGYRAGYFGFGLAQLSPALSPNPARSRRFPAGSLKVVGARLAQPSYDPT